MTITYSFPDAWPCIAIAALVAGCAGSANWPAPLPIAAELPAACPALAGAATAAAWPVAKTRIAAAILVAASPTAPEHCLIDGEINRRTGIDGQSYAIRFRLRMPTSTWNDNRWIW